MFDLNNLIDNLDDSNDFEEIPVDIDTFMGPGYLEQTGVTLSHYQKEMVEHMTQIFRPETIDQIYDKRRAKFLKQRKVREVICMLGKGAGKDYVSEVACAYVVYKLMCLKDPAKYFGKPPGDSFDIVNVAINADQARNVFFKGLARMIRNSPWFAGKAHIRQRDISFDKNITVYSGHSEAEAFEGLNLIMCVLDEIAGFEHFSGGEEDAGKSPAQALYDMYSASITSRFGKDGKIVMLSFPRSKGDFISSRYDEVVGEVIHHPKSHTFVINPAIPIDTPGNSFDIEWTEDEILTYRRPGVWALRRPSWEVNPTKHIDDYTDEFYSEPDKSLGKFAAEPQVSVGGLFGDHDAIDAFSNYNNGIDDNGVFNEWFKPSDEDVKYYVHVDLARKHDRASVAMAHVAGWRKTEFGLGDDELVPVIKVDLLKYWTPSRGNQVSFPEVREFIMDLSRRGFPIGKVTFDRWNSDDMIKFFNRAGIESELLSVSLAHYLDLKLVIAENRGQAPYDEILRRELKQLFITKNGKNVDHPKTKNGSKDLSDSVAGAVYNAISLTPKKKTHEFDIKNIDDYRTNLPPKHRSGTIDPPRAERGNMPPDLARYLQLI